MAKHQEQIKECVVWRLFACRASVSIRDMGDGGKNGVDHPATAIYARITLP